ncbi:hypothetical protein G7Y89_g13028 [Cudoniella acicularis]|uniref:protein-serine/threonine phosphatase n=1 Tax=Cudoniella acicularis TaxID=354080 RepID=A0A8H4VYM2_9HELO|nr:hypothetical protein G7Y89_g13028 [Cudoniella acicularis]
MCRTIKLNIGGSIYNQYNNLLDIFETAGHPPESNYLFLGNYVTRGKQSIETICLLAYKIKYKGNFFLLRGNSETKLATKIVGFYGQCKMRYNPQIWKLFMDLFSYLPIAAIIEDKIFALHGGPSPDLNAMEQISRIRHPDKFLPQKPMEGVFPEKVESKQKRQDENEKGGELQG